MKNVKPFLLNFAQPCCSPNRQTPNQDYYYDDLSDLVRRQGREDHPPAIETAGLGGPVTKKCDIEKGEDNKDRRMWQ